MANRNEQKNGQAAVERRLRGIADPRGPQGILGRGKNVYPGGSSAARRGGGPNIGRPRGARYKVPAKSAIKRRIAMRKRIV